MEHYELNVLIRPLKIYHKENTKFWRVDWKIDNPPFRSILYYNFVIFSPLFIILRHI